MATVIQVHQFLANLSLGDAAKQRALAAALEELRAKQRSGARLCVSREDLLYRLYVDALLIKPHQFERTLGGSRCVIQTNTPIERAELVVVFLHGLGASPWHFVRVASMLFAANAEKIKIAFIFPFGPERTQPGEFGAVEDSLYGSYKWWSVLNETIEPGAVTPSTEVGLLTGATLNVPSVLRDASASPRIFPPTESPKRKPFAGDSPAADPTVASGSVHIAHTPPAGSRIGDRLIAAALTPPAGTLRATRALLDKTRTYPGSAYSPAELSAMSPIRLRWYQQCGICFDRRASAGALDALEPDKFSMDNPRGRAGAHRQVAGLLLTLESKYRIPTSRVGLCGFSQGAMLALDVFHRLKYSPPAFLVVFSGAPMCVRSWRAELQKTGPTRRCPILQFHGTRDRLFPIFVGRWLHRFLLREGLNVVHEVVVAEFNNWVLQYARNRAVFNLASNQRRLWSSVANKLDDVFYRVGYGLAACVLPLAKHF